MEIMPNFYGLIGFTVIVVVVVSVFWWKYV